MTETFVAANQLSQSELRLEIHQTHGAWMRVSILKFKILDMPHNNTISREQFSRDYLQTSNINQKTTYKDLLTNFLENVS